MAINTCLSTVDSKKKNKKQNRTRFIDTQNILMVTDGRFVGGLGEEGEGIKKYELIVPE